MNNPLEAVTQAVNSLVTALKLPDESAKANEVLGEMRRPQGGALRASRGGLGQRHPAAPGNELPAVQPSAAVP